jgi:hypothetical protein
MPLLAGCSDDKVNFYRNYVTAVTVPPAIVMVCAAVHCFAAAMQRHIESSGATEDRKRRAAWYLDLKRRCVRNAAWLLVLAYSGVAKTALQLYNARRLDAGEARRHLDCSIIVYQWSVHDTAQCDHFT